jgi:hypothetical protein
MSTSPSPEHQHAAPDQRNGARATPTRGATIFERAVVATVILNLSFPSYQQGLALQNDPQQSQAAKHPKGPALTARLVRTRSQVRGMAIDATFEPHYRISEIAALWHLGREVTRQLFLCEKDVVRIRMGKKQKNTVMLVPESVMRRIHTKLTSG